VSAAPAPSPAPPTRARRALWRGLGAAALLLLAVALGLVAVFFYWSRAALPQTEGERRLAGLAQPVTVRRDGLGVPHISAASVRDAVRAQGFVTAQDRLWQMDVLRRRALGQLAEVLGEPLLRVDREIRTLGLNRAAAEALGLLAADDVALLQAYAEGVNAFIEAHALPLEFRVLRYRPRPWKPSDTLAVGKLLAHDLAQGWEGEVLRADLQRRLPPDVFDLLHPARFPDDRILFGRDEGPAAPGAAVETAVGSNNWVVSGAHTASGRPLLANDPHLGLGIPSIWTAVHLRAPGLEVAGVTLPGAPGVILGRNRRVAWGCTNVHDDNADLVAIEVDPGRPDHYRTPAGWERFRTVDEPILVRRGALAASWDSVSHPVNLTRWGPVLEVGGRQYALRLAMLEKAVEVPAFLGLDRASNWEEFRRAVSLFPGPSQNFVYADVDGHIGWYSAGRVPLRRPGDGAVPYAPTAPDADWTGFIPFADLPHVLDPPSGRIVTANNRLVGTDYPYRLTRGVVGPWRAAAIFERLEAREGWTTDDMVRLQAERLSLPHRALAQALRTAAGRRRDDAAWAEVARELDGFDGRLEPDSRAAALVVAAFRSLGERVIGPRVASAPNPRALRRRTAAIERLVRERPAQWLPAGVPDWDAVLLDAWRAAEEELGRKLGRDRAGWTLARLNDVRVRHPLSRALWILGPVLDPPPLALGGSVTSPNVLGLTPAGVVEGPSMRFVANLADPDDTRLVNFMGQSGHAASPHYDDQLAAWVAVGTHRLPFTEEAVARATRHTLRLVP
jgi:penicillin amidase